MVPECMNWHVLTHVQGGHGVERDGGLGAGQMTKAGSLCIAVF
jgi:hypothetical protein